MFRVFMHKSGAAAAARRAGARALLLAAVALAGCRPGGGADDDGHDAGAAGADDGPSQPGPAPDGAPGGAPGGAGDAAPGGAPDAHAHVPLIAYTADGVLTLSPAVAGATSVAIPGSGGDANPAFSPDGKHLVFQHEGALWTTRIDGSERALLAANPDSVLTEPAWTADGTHVAYTATAVVDDRPRIEIMTASGRDAAPLPGADGCHSAAFSPDGARIAFVRPDDGALIVAAADGSDARVLSRDGEAEPAWSPDATKLVVSSPNRTPPAGRGSLWIIDVEAGAATPLAITGAAGGETGAVFSPDGETIAYVALNDPPTDLELFLVSSRGGTPTNLTHASGWIEAPTWRPE